MCILVRDKAVHRGPSVELFGRVRIYLHWG